MRRFLFPIVLWLTVTITGPGWAATLGQAEVNSFLGQPLNVVIPLYGLEPGQQDDLRIRLADQDQFDRLDIVYTAFLSRLTFAVSQREGRWVVSVRSDDPVDEPFLDFPLQMSWPGGSLIKEFTVLLDPPTRIQSVQTSSRETTSPRVATPQRVAGRDAQYGPVQRGETLWPIAQKLKPAGITTKQMAMALLRANPNAFIDQNVNRLRAGAVLRIPPRAVIEELDAAAASAEFAAQTRSWQKPVATSPRTVNVERSATAGTVAEPIAASPERADAAATTPATDEPRVEATRVDAVDEDKLKIVAKDPADADAEAGQGNEELQRQLLVTMEEIESNRITTEALESRLARLEQEISRMEALVRLKDAQISALQSELSDEPEPGLPDAGATIAAAEDGGPTEAEIATPSTETPSETVVKTAPATDPATTAAPVTVEAVPPTPQPADTEQDWLRQTPWMIWVALGVLGLIVIVLLLQRRTSQQEGGSDELPTLYPEDGRAFAAATATAGGAALPVSAEELADLGVPPAKPPPATETEATAVDPASVLDSDLHLGDTLIEPQSLEKSPEPETPAEKEPDVEIVQESLPLDLASQPNDGKISEKDLASWAEELGVDGSPHQPPSANDEQLPVDADLPSLLDEIDVGLTSPEAAESTPPTSIEFEPVDENGDDTFAMSLDLARAYLEIGDNEGARDMLEQALAGARDPEHRRQIEELLAKI